MFSLDIRPDQRELIEEIRSIAPALEKKALEIDAAGDLIFDSSMVDLLAAHNLLAPIVPREYGGRGSDFMTMALFMEELGAICLGLSGVASATNQVTALIMLGDNQAQKDQYLPQFVQKKACLAAFALSEASAGSDVTMIQTQIRREKDGLFSINGIKDYVINGAVADYIICLGAQDPSKVRSTMLSVIVPRETPGFKVGRICQKMGVRAANSSELIFDNVRVPEANILGDPGISYLLLTQIFDRGRAVGAANAVGMARSAFNIALAYARDREQFGKSLFEHQAIAFSFAEMEADIEAARMLVWKACWLIDQDGDYTKASSIAKLYAAEMAQRVVNKCADIVAARAYMKGHPLEKMCRDARMLSTIEGTNNIQKMIIASQL